MVDASFKLLQSDTRKEVIHNLAKDLRRYYIFPEKAEEASHSLLVRLANGEYDRYDDEDGFSNALTEELQNITQDKHLRVMFTSDHKETNDVTNSLEDLKTVANNYGFHKVERLGGNIGYINLKQFIDTKLAGETAIHAMNFIANTEALIFDLRENGGGYPSMVALLSSYLFEEATYLNNFYNRSEDIYIQSWTQPYVPGKKYLDKPVYVLTSDYTFSAAEEFIYNLQNLKRATIVGEVTKGGAHPGEVRQLTKHFEVFIPTGRAINPITNTNWEGSGVEPDIKLSKEEAFDYAYKHALTYVKEKYKAQPEYQFLIDEIDEALGGL